MVHISARREYLLVKYVGCLKGFSDENGSGGGEKWTSGSSCRWRVRDGERMI